MTNDLPSWVSEYDEEYSEKYKKSRIYLRIGLGFSIIIICYLLFPLSEYIESSEILKYVAVIGMFIGFFVLLSGSPTIIDDYNKYLASMIYFIGHTLEKNSDIQSTMYISRMDNHLKNCDEIINTINGSFRDAMYVKNTSSYIEKLNKLIKLLNEFYINYPKYSIDKADIALQIIQLADLIHDDNGYITDKHINLIDLLSTDLTKNGVMEKTLYIPKTKNIISTCKTIRSEIPYNFKLVTYIALITLGGYKFIYYLALSEGITQDAAFKLAIGGCIAALVPALMVRDHIIK